MDFNTPLGQGIEGNLEGKVLYLRIDLSRKGTVSKSGKSTVVASTNGNVGLADVKIGINVYRPKA
jgi:hypothetical protein